MADFPERPSKFNEYSAAVKARCEGNLLQHQSKALTELESFFSGPETGREVALVSMPTGSGKTGIMCCLPYFLGNIGPPKQPKYPFDKPILVIAPDLAITSQLEQQMLVSRKDLTGQTFLLKRGIVPLARHAQILPTGVKLEETTDLQNIPYLEGKEIIIANAQKFLGEEWEQNLPDDMFQLVIVDEAHHHPATTWRRIVQKFQDHAMVVFFTATPYRGDGQQVLEGPLTYHLTLEDAIRNDIIRKTKFEELDSMESLEGNPLWDDASPQDREEIGRFATILRRVISLQGTKAALPDNVPHMAMAITKDTKGADKLVEVWKVLNPDAPASVYHSGVKPKRRREEVFNQILENKLKLVVVVEMLLEGFDHPPISIAAVATKIVSPVKFVQFVGRAQRIYRGTQDSEVNGIAHIVTHSHYEQGDNYRKFIQELLIPSQ